MIFLKRRFVTSIDTSFPASPLRGSAPYPMKSLTNQHR
nr:MAG TPA: hypothetical protein [Caudoviricetes sp.]